MASKAYIGLGSNLGRRQETLRRALELLETRGRVHLRALSQMIETAPTGGPTGQGDFINAVAEIEVRSGVLDGRNMVCDFSDIKRIVKEWIDREIDHKMILRHDDPLLRPLQQLNEPIFVVESNPTVEHIAKLIFDYTRSQGLPVVAVRVWETATSFATYGDTLA